MAARLRAYNGASQARSTVSSDVVRMNRNQPCPCGSGKRYKHCCGALASDSSERAQSPASLMAAALELQRAGALEAAEKRYRDVLEAVPDEPDCLHMLGVICYQTGRLAPALELIRRALDLTGWRFDAMRRNLAFVISRLLEQPPSSEGWLTDRASERGTLDAPAGRSVLRAINPVVTPLALPTELLREREHAPGTALPFTGERFVPELAGPLWHEHWHRYCVVQPLVHGLRVLDAACGEGYGSFLLAREARSVLGIDVASDTVRHASDTYRAANLSFVQGSVAALPLQDASVDAIVSFETIEHLAQQAEMIAEFRRVLTPAGKLFISSPNKAVYAEESGERNEFHVRELTREEFAALLAAPFPQQAWYGQRTFAQSIVWAESEATAGDESGGDTAEPILEFPLPPMYFVVVCGGRETALPKLPRLSALVMTADGTRLVSTDGLSWRQAG